MQTIQRLSLKLMLLVTVPGLALACKARKPASMVKDETPAVADNEQDDMVAKLLQTFEDDLLALTDGVPLLPGDDSEFSLADNSQSTQLRALADQIERAPNNNGKLTPSAAASIAGDLRAFAQIPDAGLDAGQRSKIAQVIRETKAVIDANTNFGSGGGGGNLSFDDPRMRGVFASDGGFQLTVLGNGQFTWLQRSNNLLYETRTRSLEVKFNEGGVVRFLCSGRFQVEFVITNEDKLAVRDPNGVKVGGDYNRKSANANGGGANAVLNPDGLKWDDVIGTYTSPGCSTFTISGDNNFSWYAKVVNFTYQTATKTMVITPLVGGGMRVGASVGGPTWDVGIIDPNTIQMVLTGNGYAVKFMKDKHC